MKRRRKRLIVALAAALLAAAAILVLLGLASRAAQDIIRERSDDIAGLTIDLDGMEVGWLGGSLLLRGVRIYPAGERGRGTPMGEAKAITVRVAPLDILRGRLHIRRIALDAPQIRYLCSGRRCNWDALHFGDDADEASKKSKPKESDEKSTVRIDAIEIDDGTLLYRDRTTGERLELRALDATATDIEPGDGPDDLPTKIDLTAQLGGTAGRVQVSGRSAFFGEGTSFDLRGKIHNAPATYFAPFYAGSLPFRVNGGTVALSGHGRAKRSDLTANAHVVVRDLKAGGIDGAIINKLVLKHAGTIEVDVSIAGNLDRGDFAVSSALSRSIGESILADARKLSPVRQMGETLKKAGEGVGRKIENIFGR